MLKVDQVHVIRHKLHVEGKSMRQVARELGISRNTVKKYRDQPLPQAAARASRQAPVLEAVQPRMEQLLERWQKDATDKQRITGSRLHRQLVEEGYQVGITTVRDYLRQRRGRQREAFVPLVYPPGDSAQVDFFEVRARIAGQLLTLQLFVMRLMYSGVDFARLYRRPDQISFLDAHVHALRFFGGVPHRLVYDNLSAAVRKVLFPRRRLTERFEQLTKHYLFEPCFARPGTGHDKGGVESRGRSIRWQHLVPLPDAPSLEALNEELLAKLEAQAATMPREPGGEATRRQLFEQERGHLLDLPEQPFEARRLVLASLGGRAMAKVEGAWYSAPCGWAHQRIEAYVGCEEVELVHQQQVVRHPRLAFGQRSVDYLHYLPELARKPQAVRQVIHELLPRLPAPFGELWGHLLELLGPLEAARVLARLLGQVVRQGEEAVAARVQKALEAEQLDWQGLLVPTAHEEAAPPPCVPCPAALAGVSVEQPDASLYDVLLEEPGGEP